MTPIGFYLQNPKSHEEQAVGTYCVLNRIPHCGYKYGKQLPEGYVPIGNVEWMELITGFKFDPPDYYPDFAASLLKRKIWKTDVWPFHERVFIKPSDKVKRFNGRITVKNSFRGKKKGPYWCSEVVPIVDEFRYYITNGKVVDGYWYLGENDESSVPEIDIDFPSGWCGSVDIASTQDRGLILIEAHEPYSVGWYGRLSNGGIYANWCADGYEYLRRKYNND